MYVYYKSFVFALFVSTRQGCHFEFLLEVHHQLYVSGLQTNIIIQNRRFSKGAKKRGVNELWQSFEFWVGALCIRDL